MTTQVTNKPSALFVKNIEDVMYLLRESEEKGGRMSLEESYKKNNKRLEELFSNHR